jgi:hypothetical protein
MSTFLDCRKLRNRYLGSLACEEVDLVQQIQLK